MPGESKVTTNHEEIRRWVEERGGRPAHVIRTGDDDAPGLLRIDFPGYGGEGSLEEISWEEFFRKFDESNLAFLYQEETQYGEESRFFTLISREAETEPVRGKETTAERAATSQRRTAARRAGGKKSAPKRKAAAAARPSGKTRAGKKSAGATASRKSAKKSRAAARGATKKKAATKRGVSKKAAASRRGKKARGGSRKAGRRR